MSEALDPLAAKAVETLMTSDPKYINVIKRISIKALQIQMWYMEHGTPEQQLAASSKFMPIFIKAMTATDGDKTAEEVHEQTREIISGVLKSKMDDIDEPG